MESQQCFSQISEYLLLEEGLQILSVGSNTLSPFPHPRKYSGLFKIKRALSSSLGVYPGTVNILFTDPEQRR